MPIKEEYLVLKEVYCPMCRKIHKYRGLRQYARKEKLVTIAELINFLTPEELHARSVFVIEKSTNHIDDPELPVLPDKVDQVRKRTIREHWSNPKYNTLMEF